MFRAISHFATRLVDTRRCLAVGGKGGDGLVSFRHGYPCGGSGGKGGDVLVKCSSKLSSLRQVNTEERGCNGKRGSSNRASGTRGKDRVILVPPGVLIWKGCQALADLNEEGREVVIAYGGLGGCGNNKAFPEVSGKGNEGESVQVTLELKAIADVGMVGFPNAGKSSLLGAISRASPKVASYPFTTLSPHVGTVQCTDDLSFTVADLPGLVEGAHKNVGLGHEFLRHVERTSVLLYVVDAQDDPVHALHALRSEVELYHEEVAKKPWIVACTKCDGDSQLEALERADEVYHTAMSLGCMQVVAVSAKYGLGLNGLVHALLSSENLRPTSVSP